MVSDRLGFRYVDEEIIAIAAGKEGLDPALIADAERRRTLLGRLLEGLGHDGLAEASSGFISPEPSEFRRSDDFRALITDAIHETARLGDVVIVAHAASMALAGRNDVLRVLITASPDTRARRLMEGGQAHEAGASKMVKDSDAGRADYLRRFYRVDRELPTHYDLVINTDLLGLEASANVVIGVARA
jgi:hypothetical protein